MSGFRYEKDLPHQMAAIKSVLSAFKGASMIHHERGENPSLRIEHWQENIRQIQQQNGIETHLADGSIILDIAMETGTGKTYTYTQTMYEMHKRLGLYKFIIAVPTLSIKAGTEYFLKSEALKKHFQLDFEGEYGNAEIELYVVQSPKKKKGSKNQTMPTEIWRFVEADNNNKIHVLLINMGMINSKTMKGEDAGNDGSVLLKDLFHKPYEAIASVRPILIIDEPHRFKNNQSTWNSLMTFSPQFILRYGATFNHDYRNLIYRLTAIDAFNQDLVKGVRAFVQDIQGDHKASVRFVESDGQEAIFELGKEQFKVAIGESLEKIHPHIHDLDLNQLNKTTAVLSNGLELKKGDTFNPYSYSNHVLDQMLREAVREHFKNEKLLLSRPDKIKPLTLFFIDDIKAYRDGDHITGSFKQRFEACVQEEAQKALQTAEPNSAFYVSLQKVLNNVSATHGGYFSKDNSSDDEKIAQEITEILHDKQSLLSLDNPRRFIFSKWTLREGWDNPNVFGICKLRSSGSESSKLQEVGRGLRLPVNEFGARVKDGNFMLNYFVDQSEAYFVQTLTEEINRSMVKETVFDQLNDALFEKIQTAYPDVKKRTLSNQFYEQGWMNDNDEFVADGFNQVKSAFPLAFVSEKALKKGKIIHRGQDKRKIKMRLGKYDELKQLWEMINQKAILQYQISEDECVRLFSDYLRQNQKQFITTGILTQISQTRKTAEGLLKAEMQESIEDHLSTIAIMNYRQFLEKLAQKTFIQMRTLHQAFYQLRNEIDITALMNAETIAKIHKGFNRYLLHHSLSQFQITYEHMACYVHPTPFTNPYGQALLEIDADGTVDDTSPLETFLFEHIFFDSKIERDNMLDAHIEEVVVFTKIPKNSIKIPVAGGEHYSPDFAYVIHSKQGQILNLVVESKGADDAHDLRHAEQQKIKNAEQWFKALQQQGFDVRFETQFNHESISEIIKRHLA